MNNTKVIRRADKLSMKNTSKTTNYEQENKGESCKGFSLGDRAVGYFEHEVLAEITARAAGFDNNEMKSLIDKLHGQRKNLLTDLLAQIDNVAI